MAEKNKKAKKDQFNNSSKDTNFFTRLLIPLRVLIKIHLKIASQELKKDLNRFISGTVNLFIGLFFIIGVLLLLNVAIVILFNEFVFKNFSSHGLLYATLSSAGVNLIIALLMFIQAIIKFKKPFLKDTTKLIKESIEELND